jgi:predicted outer membrane repeat protein
MHLKTTILISALLYGTALPAEVFYVNGNSRNVSASGKSWTEAFASIQEAIDTATGDSDEIWVKASVYRPAGNDRTATFALRQNTRLYGGFRGNETKRQQRNPKANRTVLSGDIGRIGSRSDNCYHVVTGASDGVLDGFIITAGHADGPETQQHGGGLLLARETRNFSALQCTFEKNEAVAGGALYADQAEATLINCAFYANSGERGGAIATGEKTMIRVVDSSFTSNFSEHSGGAASIQSGTDAGFFRSTFMYNSSGASGGALAVETDQLNGIRLGLTDTTFKENTAHQNGGALSLIGPFSPLLEQCRFFRNAATLQAGGLEGRNGAKVKMEKCSFIRNTGGSGNNDVYHDETSTIAKTEVDTSYFFANLKNTLHPGTKGLVLPTKKPASPKRKIADVEAYLTASNQRAKLRELTLKNRYTVFSLGDLTDPAFIKGYRTLEAAAVAYQEKGIGFFHIYRHLAHPENHGYVRPLRIQERARHVELATDLLHTRIPWLYDPMDNQSATELAQESDNNIFIFSSEGREEYAGSFDDTAALLRTLAKLAGPATNLPAVRGSLDAPDITPINMPETKLVQRIQIDPANAPYHAVRIVPLESSHPAYVKPRIEASTSLLETGKGRLYLGFHLDPLYPAEWNNISDSLKYIMKAPRGSAIAPSINTAPKITGQATDAEPREFLLTASKLTAEQPLPLQVVYSIYSAKTRRNISITQNYAIYIERDPFGGEVFNRQTSIPAPTGKRRTVKSNVSKDPFDLLAAKYDLDRDGKISKDEAAGKLLREFENIDGNQDGFVEKKEFSDFQKQ